MSGGVWDLGCRRCGRGSWDDWDDWDDWDNWLWAAGRVDLAGATAELAPSTATGVVGCAVRGAEFAVGLAACGGPAPWGHVGSVTAPTWAYSRALYQRV